MEGSITRSVDGISLDRPAGRGIVRNPYLQSRRKRLVDIAGALGIGVVFSPVIVALVSIMAFQNGPIIFGHERVGHRGKKFRCYKFRSMVPDADQVLSDLLENDSEARAEWERDFKLKRDPRVTRIGNFLRKTSLDELPQLWNVLKGEMSLVGPRPIVREELARYGRGARFYLNARPGLTGLWQVSGRSDIDYGRRVAMDRTYSERAGFQMDVNIIARTVLVVLKVKGAY
ncbi:sugar transferase [Algiphilus aromaticivorans]|uniref:sugar transferase n=1 Tax=Algiphilus aromaticivorans TaxID=382454 RepID=UPI000A06FEE6|nr:sugar transferase [Algiphilus aromaticivorans]